MIGKEGRKQRNKSVRKLKWKEERQCMREGRKEMDERRKKGNE